MNNKKADLLLKNYNLNQTIFKLQQDIKKLTVMLNKQANEFKDTITLKDAEIAKLKAELNKRQELQKKFYDAKQEIFYGNSKL